MSIRMHMHADGGPTMSIRMHMHVGGGPTMRAILTLSGRCPAMLTRDVSPVVCRGRGAKDSSRGKGLKVGSSSARAASSARTGKDSARGLKAGKENAAAVVELGKVGSKRKLADKENLPCAGERKKKFSEDAPCGKPSVQ